MPNSAKVRRVQKKRIEIAPQLFLERSLSGGGTDLVREQSLSISVDTTGRPRRMVILQNDVTSSPIAE